MKETAWLSVGEQENEMGHFLSCSPCYLSQIEVLAAEIGRGGAGALQRAPEAEDGPSGQSQKRKRDKARHEKWPGRHNVSETA